MLDHGISLIKSWYRSSIAIKQSDDSPAVCKLPTARREETISSRRQDAAVMARRDLDPVRPIFASLFRRRLIFLSTGVRFTGNALPPELDHREQTYLAAGGYQSEYEVLRTALAALEEREQE
jgi:hypothetical protein